MAVAEKIPMTDIKSAVITKNPKYVREVLEDRLLNHWINKNLFQEETLIILVSLVLAQKKRVHLLSLLLIIMCFVMRKMGCIAFFTTLLRSHLRTV